MIVAVDLEQLADAAFDEAQRHPSCSPGRRAASHLWISCTIPPAKSVAAVERAIASFGAEHVQADAMALLRRLASERSAA